MARLGDAQTAASHERRDGRKSGLSPKFCLESAAEQRALAEIDAALDSSSTLGAAFARIVAAIGQVLPVRAMVVVPREERERSLVWSASRRDRAEAEAEVVGAAALAWLLADDRAARAVPSSRFAWISLPVVDERARVLGLLSVSTATAPVSERHVAFVAAVACALAEPMSRPLGFDDGAPRDGAVVASPELASLAFDDLDYADALRHVVRAIGGRIADGCVVVLDGKDGTERIAFAPTFDDRTLDAALGSAVAAVRRRGETVATAQRDADALDAARSLGVHTVVVCLIVNRGAPLGTLAIVAREPTSRLDVGEVEQLAHRAAVAIENGRAYECALDALAERDRVLFTVSHDLKNPLGVILLATSRALEGLDDAGADAAGKRQIETIRRSAHRMRTLVADILAVAAIDGGAMPMRPTRCELRPLVDEALEAIALQADQRGVRLLDEIPAGLAHVWADGDRILQVLGNLLGNAIKFTSRGGTVAVRACAEPDAIRVAVVDDGCGITPEDLPRVFDRFWQSAEASKRGTGLGLAICKAIVAASGGQIEAHSEVGVGTTMYFTLPLARRGPELVRAGVR